MRLLSVLLMLLVSHSVSAQVPPGTVLAFQGMDASGQGACHLFVTGVQQNASGAITAVRVQTSYRHGHDVPVEIIAVPVAGRQDVLSGMGPNGKDQIALFWGRPNDPRSFVSFNFKWWHVNHFHTFQCNNLQAFRN